MGQEAPVQVRGFKGLNVAEAPSIIQDTELSDLVNFNVGRAGELVARTGFIKISSGAVLPSADTIILGQYVYGAFSQLIVKCGGNVYYSNDGITYVLLGAYADAAWGVQYAGLFYIIRSANNIVQWDGATAANIAGSPAGTFAIMQKDRMFVLNTSGVGVLNSRFYFSNAGDVSATGWPGTNFIDVRPGDGDVLTGMVVIQDLLVVFKGTSTWALYIQGAPADWVLRSLNTEIGCVSKYAMQLVDGILFFSAATGIYRTEGASFDKVSEQITPVLLNRLVNSATVNIDCFAYWEDKLICLLAPDASTKVYYVYHLKAQAWSKWEFAGGIIPTSFYEVLSNSPQRGLYAGDLTGQGRILRFGDEQYTDLGSTYVLEAATKQYDFDAPTVMKRGKWVGIDIVGLTTLSWSHEVDDVQVSNGSIVTQADRAGAKIKGPGYFRDWKMVLSLSVANPITLIGFTLHMQQQRSTIKALT